MKRFLLLSITLAFTMLCTAQNFKENRKKADKIKANPEYYFGESGECKNPRKADEEALQELLDNIASDKSLQPLYFKNSDDEYEQHQRIISTFGDVLKRQAFDIVLNDAIGSSKTFRYIKKTDFADICDMRETKIKDYIREAIGAEELYRVGDALRYYYWALMLCHSHPDGGSLMYKDESGIEVNCYKWLVRSTVNLLNDIVFIPVKQDKAGPNEFLFKVCCNGNNVDGLNYTYNDGNGTVRGSVHNGVSNIKLVHSDMHNVNVVIDLENTEAVKFYDPEVYSIMNVLEEQIDFPDSKKTISLDKVKKINKIEEVKTYPDKEIAMIMVKSEEFINTVETTDSQADYIKTMEKIEKAIAKKDLYSVEKHFTKEGFDMLMDLLSYGKCKILGKQTYKLLEYGDQMLCRTITMQFDFKNNVSFIRDVVFRFDRESKKVKSIAFRLTDITESQILAKEKWSDEARLTLINFIEDYQTAYALKRKDYLNQVFSESALIIVGNVLKETRKTDNIQLNERVRIKYDTLSKSQYLKRLERVFSNNEFINIRFTNTSFNTVNNINNVIGVQLRQEYFSSSYGDVGYLFLMVDLRHEKPIIHVRTWQPNETPVDDLINEKSFVFM